MEKFYVECPYLYLYLQGEHKKWPLWLLLIFQQCV